MCVSGGGWREREKAREESWGPPRDGAGHDDEEDEEEADVEVPQESEPNKDRRPPPPRYNGKTKQPPDW